MNRSYSRNDILTAFKEVGLQKDDTVFVTTSLGMLGIPEGIESSDDLNQLFFDVLKDFFGAKGNVIVPTYSYTFGRSISTNLQVFDPKSTPSEVGPFPDFFRKQPGVLRSLDPMMSVAGFGQQIPELFENLPATSYGEGSIFARLTRISAKCCSIGLGPNWMPFIHYADWLCKSPFRYDKLFKGIIKEGDNTQTINWLYSVPLLHQASHSTGHKVARLAEQAGIWQFSNLGRARVYAADYRRYFDFTVEQLKKDPWMTADGPPADPLEIELQRVPANTPSVTTSDDTPEKILCDFSQFHRCEVSDHSGNIISQLGKYWNLQTLNFLTGESHLDWVIPERWQLDTASISDENGQSIIPEEELLRKAFAYSPSRTGVFTKAELSKHIRCHPSNASFSLYLNTVLNRDWGFSLSTNELKDIPDVPLKINIKASSAFGQLKIAASEMPDGRKPFVIIVGYINGPAGGKDLISAWAANAVFQRLKNEQSETNVEYLILLLPGPVGFAAWLSTHANIRHKILGVLEFCRLLPGNKPEIRVPETFIDQEFVKLWKNNCLSSNIIERANDKAYLLTCGENPLAEKRTPTHEFPVISLGNPLANELLYNPDDTDPFEKLSPDDFSSSHEMISEICKIQSELCKKVQK
ncbi:MAG: DUF2172 domain-containing protein [Candidatus Riflebacteria bacterium]|nr:DUF2172 domain-containing protein [Candidatus Riflebacteria bacterium]